MPAGPYAAHICSCGSLILVPELAEFACRKTAGFTIFMSFMFILALLLDGSHLFCVGTTSVFFHSRHLISH